MLYEASLQVTVHVHVQTSSDLSKYCLTHPSTEINCKSATSQPGKCEMVIVLQGFIQGVGALEFPSPQPQLSPPPRKLENLYCLILKV